MQHISRGDGRAAVGVQPWASTHALTHTHTHAPHINTHVCIQTHTNTTGAYMYVLRCNVDVYLYTPCLSCCCFNRLACICIVQFSVSDRDVEALATIGLASSKISDVISSGKQPCRVCTCACMRKESYMCGEGGGEGEDGWGGGGGRDMIRKKLAARMDTMYTYMYMYMYLSCTCTCSTCAFVCVSFIF